MCTKGVHFGEIRLPARSNKDKNPCSRFNTRSLFTIKIGDYSYQFPLQNIISNGDYGPTEYCETQIGLLYSNDNSIVLGDAFFTQFLAIFDIENDRLGLA